MKDGDKHSQTPLALITSRWKIQRQFQGTMHTHIRMQPGASGCEASLPRTHHAGTAGHALTHTLLTAGGVLLGAPPGGLCVPLGAGERFT